MKTILFVVAAFYLSGSPVQKNALLGTWVSEKDPNWTIRFDKQQMYNIYGKDTTSSRYYRSKRSCDPDYYTSEPNKFDFIKVQDGECYEITGLSDSVLAYRHTATGKLQVFLRLPQKKR